MTEFNFSDEVDMPREGVENREKRQFLKDLITQGKKLPGKKPWTVELIDQASNEEVENYTLNILRKNFNTREKKLAKQWGNT